MMEFQVTVHNPFSDHRTDTATILLWLFQTNANGIVLGRTETLHWSNYCIIYE
jgi:hypothetical protein